MAGRHVVLRLLHETVVETHQSAPDPLRRRRREARSGQCAPRRRCDVMHGVPTVPQSQRLPSTDGVVHQDAAPMVDEPDAHDLVEVLVGLAREVRAEGG